MFTPFTSSTSIPQIQPFTYSTRLTYIDGFILTYGTLKCLVTPYSYPLKRYGSPVFGIDTFSWLTTPPVLPWCPGSAPKKRAIDTGLLEPGYRLQDVSRVTSRTGWILPMDPIEGICMHTTVCVCVYICTYTRVGRYIYIYIQSYVYVYT